MSIEVVIEIAKGSHVKYEYDKEKSTLVCDRVLHTPMKYPFNYGFIPNTLSEDRDPLDVVVLMDDPLIPGCSVTCRLVGYLDTEDDEGNDPKLLAVPVDRIDPSMSRVKDIADMLDRHGLLVKRVRHFFQHYKDLENKTVRIGEFGDRDTAYQLWKDGKDRYLITKGLFQKNKITNYFQRV